MKTPTRILRPEVTPRRGNSDESGFTLLETSISLVLMAIVGLGSAATFFFMAKNLESAGDRHLAMAVAQQRLEQLRNAAFSDASLSQTSTSGTSLSLARAGRQYSVVTTITNANVVNGTPTAKTIVVRVTPDRDSSVWARTVTSVFGSVTLRTVRSAQTVGPNRAL